MTKVRTCKLFPFYPYFSNEKWHFFIEIFQEKFWNNICSDVMTLLNHFLYPQLHK